MAQDSFEARHIRGFQAPDTHASVPAGNRIEHIHAFLRPRSLLTKDDGASCQFTEKEGGAKFGVWTNDGFKRMSEGFIIFFHSSRTHIFTLIIRWSIIKSPI